jgi:hypothetical protein
MPQMDAHCTAGIDDLTDSLVIQHDAPDEANGGGTHYYVAMLDGVEVARIQFQHGPRGADDSTPGVTLLAMLTILIHHTESFQNGPFKSRLNALTITHMEEARNRIMERIIDRRRRNVLGKLEA